MRLHELQFVERLRVLAGTDARPQPGSLRLRTGIGDDCAVLGASSRQDLLVTTDLFMEEIHFRRQWQSANSVGHKVLTRGLSDIAAMGGKPRLAFLSVAIPPRTTQRWVDGFLAGFLSLAKQYSVILAGGDTGSSPSGFMADIIVMGEAPRGRAIMRSGAKPGDEIWVSGTLGGAAAELRQLRRSGRPIARGSANPYFYPQARIAVGQYLRTRGLATAMMDITDGLSIDLFRLSQASGVGAELDGESIPRGREAELDDSLHGGDDFELLFTVPGKLRGKVPAAIGGVTLTRVGRITRQRRLLIRQNGKARALSVKGYQHF